MSRCDAGWSVLWASGLKVRTAAESRLRWSDRIAGRSVGRGGGIRTHDLIVPNDTRYQAAPRPDRMPVVTGRADDSRRRAGGRPRCPCSVNCQGQLLSDVGSTNSAASPRIDITGSDPRPAGRTSRRPDRPPAPTIGSARARGRLGRRVHRPPDGSPTPIQSLRLISTATLRSAHPLACRGRSSASGRSQPPRCWPRLARARLSRPETCSTSAPPAPGSGSPRAPRAGT